MSEWPELSISELATIEIGGTPSRAIPAFWAEKPSGHPWISIADLKGKYVSNTKEHITSLGVRSSNVKLIPDRTTVMSFKLTVGRTAITATEMYCNEAIAIFQPKDGRLDASWLYHALPRAAGSVVTDTAVKGVTLNKAKMAAMSLRLPPPAEQASIAHVLDTLDTAIHETEALIAKLKAVKQGLLHDLLTRGIDANGELRPPQPEAPHLYKQSTLGWIPKGWAFGELQTWLNGRPRNGYSPQVAGEWTGIQMLGLGCLTHEGFEPLQLKSAPRGDRRLVPAMLADGDLLVSRSNTRDLVGLAGVYRDVGTPCSYPDLMMRLNASDETRGEFLELVLRSPQLRRQIEAHAVGTSGSMVKVSGRIVSALMVTMPPIDEQERILICLNAARSRIDAEIEELSTLHELKSGLMDDLLTGRVRVTPLLASESEGSA